MKEVRHNKRQILSHPLKKVSFFTPFKELNFKLGTSLLMDIMQTSKEV